MKLPRENQDEVVLSTTRESPGPSIAIQALKFLIAAALVVHLTLNGHIGWTALWTSFTQWQYSAPAFLLLALMPFVQFWRWQSLLRATQVCLPHREVFSYLMVSKFFNMAFPGYISGDILRGLYVLRRTKGKRLDPASPGLTAIVASIVFDRIAGVLPLFGLCLAGLLNSLWNPIPRPVVVWGGLLAGLGILVPLALCALAYHQPEAPASLTRLAGWVRLDRAFVTLYRGTRRYARNLPLMRKVLSISLLNQSLAVASFIVFAKTLGIQASFGSYLVLVPLGLLTTAIPISPAGLGVGQLAFLTLFRLVGTSEGANLFTLYMASYVLINLLGAILYVFPAHGRGELRSSVLAEARRR